MLCILLLSLFGCRDKIVAYRRYTGGGTVVVDKNTVFTTLIANVSKNFVAYIRSDLL